MAERTSTRAATLLACSAHSYCPVHASYKNVGSSALQNIELIIFRINSINHIAVAWLAQELQYKHSKTSKIDMHIQKYFCLERDFLKPVSPFSAYSRYFTFSFVRNMKLANIKKLYCKTYKKICVFFSFQDIIKS